MVSQVLSEAVVEEVEQSLRPAKVISVLPCSGIRIVYIMPRLPLLCAAGWGELGTKGEQLVGPAHVSELSEAAEEEVEHSLRTAKVISVPPPPPVPSRIIIWFIIGACRCSSRPSGSAAMGRQGGSKPMSTAAV